MAIIVKKITRSTIFSLLAVVSVLAALGVKVFLPKLFNIEKLGRNVEDVFGINKASADSPSGGGGGGEASCSGSGGMGEATCGESAGAEGVGSEGTGT